MKTINLEEVVMKEPIRPPEGLAPHVWNDYWRDKKAYNDWVKGKSNGEAKPEPEPPQEKPVAPEPTHSKPAEVVTLKTKAKTPSGGDVLGELNEVWSVIVDGGKTRVHRAMETEIVGQKRWISETLTVADFRNAYANRSVRVGKSEVDQIVGNILAASFCCQVPTRFQTTS